MSRYSVPLPGSPHSPHSSHSSHSAHSAHSPHSSRELTASRPAKRRRRLRNYFEMFHPFQGSYPFSDYSVHSFLRCSFLIQLSYFLGSSLNTIKVCVDLTYFLNLSLFIYYRLHIAILYSIHRIYIYILVLIASKSFFSQLFHFPFFSYIFCLSIYLVFTYI